MKGKGKRRLALFLAFCVATATVTVQGNEVSAEDGVDNAASNEYDAENAAYITFSDSAAAPSTPDSGSTKGYKVEGTTVTISKAGTYVFDGSCKDGKIEVKKSTTDVIIVLDSLTLTSAGNDTAAIECGKDSEVKVVAKSGTTNLLADTASNDNGKAAVKAKSGAVMEFLGAGTLNVNGMYKNGIKGAANSQITVDGQTLNIILQTVDPGSALASDNLVTVNSGNVTIESDGNGIKSSPDRGEDTAEADKDLESKGDIVINGGSIEITSVKDGIEAADNVVITDGDIEINSGKDGIKSSPDTGDEISAGDVTIGGGNLKIFAAEDGIQGDNNITINGGTYIIMTNGGSSTQLASDADSCKGIKAGNLLTINDGTFDIDSADDAIHSNQYISVQGGKFDIKTGDDVMHADTSLVVGSATSEEASPEITVNKSYEGLEAGTVYIYRGDINIEASDDGINAAGGASSGSNPGNPGGRPDDGFNPGGGMPGGSGSGMPGGPGGGNPGDSGSGTSGETGGSNGGNTAGTNGTGTAASDYAIYVCGGSIDLMAGGDGLDSNGDIYISGGELEVYGAASNSQGRDNSPYDCEGKFEITGGIVFGAGSGQMAERPTAGTTQKYFESSNTTYKSGTTINIKAKNEDAAVYTTTLKEEVNYILYSAPDMVSTSSYEIVTGTEIPTKTDIKTCDIQLSEEQYVYDGTAKKPEVTVKDGNKTLVQGTDYSVSYKDNVEAGTATVTVTGIGANYTGTATKSFTITAKSQGDDDKNDDDKNDDDNHGDNTDKTAINAGTFDIKLSQTSYVYDGTAKEPVVTITTKDGSKTLVRNTDYTITYAENTNAGTGKVIIKGIGNYTGEATLTFTIQAAGQKEVTVSQVKNLTAKTVNTKQIDVSWSSVEGADGYLLYRLEKGKKQYQLVKTIASNTVSIRDAGLKPGTVYQYKVCAYVLADGKQICGAYSAVVPAAAKPAKCTIKSAKAKKKSVKVTWKKTTGSGYQIYCSTKKNFAGAKKVTVKKISKTSAAIKKLKSKKTYYIKIRAYTTVGKTPVYGAWSKVKRVKVK